MVNDKQLSREDIEQVAKTYGVKLAFLLYASKLPQQKRLAWIMLLPKMSLKQIERLTGVLEQQYAEQETQDIDKKFKKELEDIKREHDKKMETVNKIDDETFQKIEELTKDLK